MTPQWIQLRGLARRAMLHLGSRKKQRETAKRHREDFYKNIWTEAADTLGAKCVQLGDHFIDVTSSDRRTFLQLNYTPLDDPVKLRLAGNKPLVASLLREQQIPVAPQTTFTLRTFTKATGFLAEHKLCVVKPANGTGGGQGVVTSITSSSQLKQAIISSAGFCKTLVIEKQISGHNVRLLFLDGELIDAVQRNPPAVIGDGKHSLKQLIHLENRKRIEKGHAYAQTILDTDTDMKNTLASQGISLRSVPSKGTSVIVKTAINDNTADDNIAVRESVHPEVVTVARRAAAAIGLRLAGIDVITSDISKPLMETGGVVLEVNSTPGLFIHYARKDGPSNVAVPILQACLETAHPSRDVNAAGRHNVQQNHDDSLQVEQS